MFVTVHGRSGDDVTALDTVQARYDDQNKELQVVSDETISNLSVELITPTKSGVCAYVSSTMSWRCGEV